VSLTALPAIGDTRYLHPFPTRRSSDLAPRGATPVADMHAAVGASAHGATPRAAPGSAAAQPLVGLQVYPRGLQQRRLQAMYPGRSEEHTSELQSRENLVCRLLLEKKKH